MKNELGGVANLSRVQALQTPFIRLSPCKHRNLARHGISIDRIIFQPVRSLTAAFNGLQSGKVNLSTGETGATAKPSQTQEGFRCLTVAINLPTGADHRLGLVHCDRSHTQKGRLSSQPVAPFRALPAPCRDTTTLAAETRVTAMLQTSPRRLSLLLMSACCLATL